jgi:predicted RNA-binding protein (TIGR00451 family)
VRFMTRDWSMKKRRPVRRKKVAPLLVTLEQALSIDLQVDGAFLEMAEYGPWSMVLVNKIAKAIEVKNEENERFVFLTLRGFLEHDDAAKWVEVDHGAIPFLMKGADCMVAGVHAADASIEVGDLVWIRDMKHKRPLAIGWSTMNADDLTNLSKGKGIKTLHWVGDELWDMEP